MKNFITIVLLAVLGIACTPQSIEPHEPDCSGIMTTDHVYISGTKVTAIGDTFDYSPFVDSVGIQCPVRLISGARLDISHGNDLYITVDTVRFSTVDANYEILLSRTRVIN